MKLSKKFIAVFIMSLLFGSVLSSCHHPGRNTGGGGKQLTTHH